MKNIFRYPRVPVGIILAGIVVGVGTLLARIATEKSVYDPKPPWLWPLAAAAMVLFFGGIVLLCWFASRSPSHTASSNP